MTRDMPEERYLNDPDLKDLWHPSVRAGGAAAVPAAGGAPAGGGGGGGGGGDELAEGSDVDSDTTWPYDDEIVAPIGFVPPATAFSPF
jgi:hypothetical protein